MKGRILCAMSPLFLFTIALGGCIQTSDKVAETIVINPHNAKVDEFVFLNNTYINSDLTICLAQFGYDILPFLNTSYVEKQHDVSYGESHSTTDASGAAQYSESTKEYIHSFKDKYGLHIDIKVRPEVCLFSANRFLLVTMTVIDLQENKNIMIIKQIGPNGECPPLTPVWNLVAQEFDSRWHQSSH